MRSGLKREQRTVHKKGRSFRQTYWTKEDLPHPHEAQRKMQAAGLTTASQHLKFEPGFMAFHSNRGVEAGLRHVSAVHAIPKSMPQIPVKVLLLASQTNGLYKIGDAKTSEIMINRICAGPRGTTAHEMGHFLDHHLFGSGKPGMQNMGSHMKTEELEMLYRAIYNTPAVRSLSIQGKTAITNGDFGRAQVCRYLLTPTELFARAYAQYIAVRSGNEALRFDIRGYRVSWAKYGYRAQWQDKEFGPVAHQMEALLRRRGLLNEGLPRLDEQLREGVGRH